ncbi:MAG: right-handed parallel beta-helix repeat-containing protein, partial [Pirellulaceae bacterium]
MSFASRAAGWLCLVIVLVAAASTPVSAANYYVRTTGNDSNSGTSKNAAYRTVQKAVSKASAGDRVYIGAGTYSESITFPRDGNLLQSIRFIGDTNGTKTGDAGTVVITAPGIVMDLSSDNFIQLEKLTISGGTTGIRIASGLGVVVQECTVQNTAGIGIDVTNSVVIIERTAVSGPTGKGISFNGSSYILVNCLIQDAGGIGLHSKSVSLLSVATHVTVVRSSSDGILHDGGLLALYDTISANCSGRGLVQSSGLMTHDYNVVYNNTGGNFSGTSKQSHESIDDPKFLSASDFHLQSSGSSAMDQGTYLLVNEDLEGTKRPAGGRVDIGCYEGSGSGGGVVTSKEYYVRATGDDTKSGRSPASAFRTLTKAASVVTPGETVYVGAGTFTGVVELSNKAGTVTDKIQFLADTTGAKTGDAGDVIVDGAFYLRYSSYIVVDGFSVATAGSRPSWSTALAGVYADQSPDVELKSLSVTGGEHAIFATGAQNLSVVQCEATNATSHTYAFTASTTATVQDCMSEAAGGSGFYAAASTVNVSGAETHASASRGYHFATSGGSISCSSSADDGLGAELVGLTGNATSLNVS